MPNHGDTLARKIVFPAAAALLFMGSVFSVRAQKVTTLQELTQTMNFRQQAYRDVRLEVTVCAASRPAIGVLVVEDDSGAELLEVGDFGKEIHPGDRIRLQGQHCFLRKRETGVEISGAPVVDNDGTHAARTVSHTVSLRAGLTPLRLDWFNYLGFLELGVSLAESNGSPHNIDSSNLWHAVEDESGRTNFLPGLRAVCYEGYWETMPDFDLLPPAKDGMVTNFDLGFRTRDENVGIRYTGYFNAPCDGQYEFKVRSDDGSLLFLANPELPVERLGAGPVPGAAPGFYGEAMNSLAERRWLSVKGRASYVTRKGTGLEFELRSDRDVISVWLADAAGLEPSRLLNAEVKATGVGLGVMTPDQRVILGRLFAANAGEIVVEKTNEGKPTSVAVTSVSRVRSLPVEAARGGLPVRIQGVATGVKLVSYERWMSIQDDTGGIFVNLSSITNERPAWGELWEVEGRSGAGDFAPVIIADKIVLLGNGRLPEPVRPTWTELLNGSMDVQWAELHGLVVLAQSNTISLLLPEGQTEILMHGYYESQLKPFEKSVVHIRGVLYATWNAQTREVRVGSVMMRNASISVDAPAPADPFDTVVKTPRELKLFDAQATAFRRVKIYGQIVYADPAQLFLEANGLGLRLLPTERTKLQPGDMVEAVGYPDLGSSTLLLREALLRKNGEAALPEPKTMSESTLAREDLEGTRVRIQGQLLGWHLEAGAPVFEMQSGTRLYLARLHRGGAQRVIPRPGSRLLLEGVYVGRGHGPGLVDEAESFELLLNSAADITVLSQPSWWTLQKLLILMIALLVILAFTVIWITQLRRLVEQRTGQLQREILERERIEHQHALEAERSRIARDLHDDLGSSLTEIGVLASTGQHPHADGNHSAKLFDAIASKARQLVAALDVIVWAVDPEDDSLHSLADYLCGFTSEYLSPSGIACRVKVPVTFPPVTLDGQVRHELLMAVKEALNNIVRHANATEVGFHMAMTDNGLEIAIVDDGKGFENGVGRDGHGLKNLPARLKKLGGNCQVESQVGRGTTVRIRLPLPAPPEQVKTG